MLVKCINDTRCSSLCIGTEYPVIEEGANYFVVIDDHLNEITTKKERFVIVEDNDISKKAKATINELTHQLENDFPDIKDFKTRKNSKGEIKEIVIKFNY
ncbi:hypothetical protein [Clostridium gasigenes]|uniref:Uncharacterized protein n=1 Tax=Clostridium gasigenes TaxID=94869 RepID=A0A1H0SKX2_9CLOT|nr:hypothetical protein [Clostridium gasigenes]MBB6623537.1 hypothetical protein [Clostridium gasigenes]MBB6715417.1 hypothetical protein [Clostridium gasigenes]MBU3089022.1 hypothetical protein [Clostridium gasigenes]MBU3104819.1 hypothetical protein [Clostridium gasigenes]MBU3137238.1 hypothetical protein [Clostridium gasigenes]